jgi:hypothetical protein
MRFCSDMEMACHVPFLMQMPDLIREITQHASERCSDNSRSAIRTESQKIIRDFLKAELDLAFTMLNIAMETGRDADRRTFLNVAPNSINSVSAFAAKITESSDTTWMRARVRILESSVTKLKSMDDTRRRVDRSFGQLVSRTSVDQIRHQVTRSFDPV